MTTQGTGTEEGKKESDFIGHQDEPQRIFPKTVNGTESLPSSQGLSRPPTLT